MITELSFLGVNYHFNAIITIKELSGAESKHTLSFFSSLSEGVLWTLWSLTEPSRKMSPKPMPLTFLG